MHILLVEDDADLADGIIKNLKEERFSVDWVPSGEKGVALGRLNPYDGAIVDVRLAGAMSGLDVCKAIRDRGQTYPILMLSGTRDAPTKVKALNLGADDYLTKPFVFAELLARLRALLRRERPLSCPSSRSVRCFGHAEACRDASRKSLVPEPEGVCAPGIFYAESRNGSHAWHDS